MKKLLAAKKLAVKYRNLYVKSCARVITDLEDYTHDEEMACKNSIKNRHRLPWEKKR